MSKSVLLSFAVIVLFVAGCGESSALDGRAEPVANGGDEQSGRWDPVSTVHAGAAGAIDTLFYVITLGYDEENDTRRYSLRGRGPNGSGGGFRGGADMGGRRGSFGGISVNPGNISISCHT